MSWTLLSGVVLVLLLSLLAVVTRRGELRRMGKAVRERERLKRLGGDDAVLRHPVVDLSRCLGCGTCAAVCPEDGVLEIVHGQAVVVNGSRCEGISACERECPVGAITVTIANLEKRRDVPVVDEGLEAVGSPGLFLAGEVTAHGLIKVAIEHGTEVAAEVARRARESEPSGNGALDLLIVGAGPAGLACALEATRHGLDFRVIDQETHAGGTVAKYPRRKLVLTQPVDMPLGARLARTSYTKEELMELWTALVEEHDLPIEGGLVFQGLEREADGAYRVDAGTKSFRARHVCLAIGRRGVPRKLGVPGEELSKVAYSLIDAASYEGRRILVVGGGDTAVETALGLAEQAGNEVTLSYRRAGFFRLRARNDERLKEAVDAGRVALLLDSDVREIREGVVVLAQRVAAEEPGAEREPASALPAEERVAALAGARSGAEGAHDHGAGDGAARGAPGSARAEARGDGETAGGSPGRDSHELASAAEPPALAPSERAILPNGPAHALDGRAGVGLGWKPREAVAPSRRSGDTSGGAGSGAGLGAKRGVDGTSERANGATGGASDATRRGSGGTTHGAPRVAVRPAERRIELPNDEVFVMAGGLPPFELLERSGVSFDPAQRALPPSRAAALGERGTGLVRALAIALGLALATLAWALFHHDYYLLPSVSRPAHEKHGFLRPGQGLGLAFGIVAVLLVVANLAYLVRRSPRFRFQRGSLTAWMTSHVATGILAFLLATLHGAMDPRDTAGGHAWWALAALLVSGAIGRYLYAWVPRAANGRELELSEVKARLAVEAGAWAGGERAFRERAREEIEALVERRQWKSGFLARVLALAGVRRDLRRALARIEERGREEGVDAGQVRATLDVTRRAWRTALAAAHLEDLRAVVASWRWIHRWVAVLMVILVALHVAYALIYGESTFGGAL